MDPVWWPCLGASGGARAGPGSGIPCRAAGESRPQAGQDARSIGLGQFEQCRTEDPMRQDIVAAVASGDGRRDKASVDPLVTLQAIRPASIAATISGAMA